MYDHESSLSSQDTPVSKPTAKRVKVTGVKTGSGTWNPARRCFSSKKSKSDHTSTPVSSNKPRFSVSSIESNGNECSGLTTDTTDQMFLVFALDRFENTLPSEPSNGYPLGALKTAQDNAEADHELSQSKDS